ncbi:MAG TPA: hypothetical protein VG817_06620 [Gemmatimonadales bacterium]|nr:hypothetical protein [Gemmatimonadales bacterium]
MIRLPLGANIVALTLAAALASCKPGTVRPSFPPVLGAPKVEIELKTAQATEVLGEILKGDTLPVTRISTRDGLIETAWFRVGDKKATGGRPLGPDVVQVRAWIDPSRTGFSNITLETVYHPLADPSLTSRQLDRQVPKDHPIGKRMNQIVTELARLYNREPPAAEPDTVPAAPKKPRVVVE